MSRTTSRTLVGLVALLLLTPIAAPQAAGPPSLAGSFPLGVYWPWERLCGHAERLQMDKWQLVDQRLEDMRAHSVDTIWVVNLNIPDLGRLAEKCAARQMRLIPGLSELHYNIEWRRNNWTYLEQQSKLALAASTSPRRSSSNSGRRLC